MRIFGKTITALFMAALITAQSALPALAQIYDPQAVFNNNFLQKKNVFKLNLPYIPAKRPAKLTIKYWAYSLSKSNLRATELLQILADQKYMASDNVYTQKSCASDYNGPLQCELSFLTSILPEAQFSAEDINLLVPFLSEKLKHYYSETDPQHSLYYRYSIIAASLVANTSAGRQMLETLLDQVRDGYSRPAQKVWAARTLAEIVYLTPYQQRLMTRELESILLNLGERLKYDNVGNHPVGFKVSNQYTAVKSFMYTVSFFAKKKDDSFLKSMITTGNFVERSAYLQNPLPGIGKDGGFMNTDGGHRHNIAFNLTTALFNTYALSGSYGKMNDFIIKYAKVKSDGKDFQNYFLFALYGLELASAYNDNLSLEGWQEQYQNFAEAIGKAIWKTYPSMVVCVTVQGGAEVCTEWAAVMEAFKVLGVLAKGTTGIIVRLLPVKQALRASVLIAARRTLWRGAGKCIAGQVPYRARKQIKIILATAFGLTMLSGDTNTVRRSPAAAPANITMPKKDVFKRIMGQP